MYRLNSAFFVALMIAVVVHINIDEIGINYAPWMADFSQLIFILMAFCFSITFATKRRSLDIWQINFHNSSKVTAAGRYTGTALGCMGLLITAITTLNSVV